MKIFKFLFCLTVIWVSTTAGFAEAMVNSSAAKNRFVVKFSGDTGTCTGTFVGPQALLSSGHCLPGLKTGDSLTVYHYNNTSYGEYLNNYSVTKFARNTTGQSGLLLIELDKKVPRYTDVCQETFEQRDFLQQYGSARDRLRTRRQGVGRANTGFYYFWPSIGEKGDSGGPYMYQNSVAAVHYGHRWNRRVFGDKSIKDVAVNLQNGWVFNQDIYVSMRHCRPERSLAFAQGLARGGCSRVTASGNKIKVASYNSDHMEFEDSGTITLRGGATAAGTVKAGHADFKRVEASRDGRGITFYTYDDLMDDWTAKGTISLHGVKVSGRVTCGNIRSIRGVMREIAIEDVDEFGDPVECGRLRLLPVD